jgi:DNA-binding PadR family transcriptional regulator
LRRGADIFYKRESIEFLTMNIGALEQHVLMAVVALHPNAYGVSIQDHIQGGVGYRHSIGSIYAALGRLEGKGYIQSRQGEVTRQRGGRAKLYFTVTAAGQETLQESLRAIASLQRGLRWRQAFRCVEVFA